MLYLMCKDSIKKRTENPETLYSAKGKYKWKFRQGHTNLSVSVQIIKTDAI